MEVVSEPSTAGTEASSSRRRVEAHAVAAAAGARDVRPRELEACAERSAAGVGQLAVLVRRAKGVLALGDAAGAELGDAVAGESKNARLRRE
jgi:hypothetical protein